jgi:prepilin-type N-terminal cleavage/methylation domain-containing protein
MNNNITNSKGITLVELLATLVIISIISTLCYQVLFQGYSNYKRIKIESELRDEADLIMASLVKEMFVLKKSEIQNHFTCPDYYLNVQENGSSQVSTIGIKDEKVTINGEDIEFYNNDVKLITQDCSLPSTSTQLYSSISNKLNDEEYTIHIVLNRNGKVMEFENTIKVISSPKEED